MIKKSKVRYFKSDDKDFKSSLKKHLYKRKKNYTFIKSRVSKILSDIKKTGDMSLIKMVNKYDGNKVEKLNDLKIHFKQLKEAFDDLPLSHKEALKFASKRIKLFHEKQIPISFEFKDKLGVKLGLQYTCINNVGFYVPAGRALYPSSVLMNAIPADVAGVKKRILVSPISLNDKPQIIFAAAFLAEVTDFFAIGGAHAIGALAYGTKTIPRVDKIFGPGNSYVAEAKRQVFGDAGIDSIAGPSEILVVSDNKNNPEWIAYDLLSQSEHDEDAQAILITDDLKFAKEIELTLENILKNLPRRTIASKSWYENGAIILIDKISNSHELINYIAPEHLQLTIDKPAKMLKKIENAGSVFLGRYTPESIGDYVAGPNHVLPTLGSARFSSGLGVSDFFKRTTFIECNKNNFLKLSKHASVLAELEGLDAHKFSMKVRE